MRSIAGWWSRWGLLAAAFGLSWSLGSAAALAQGQPGAEDVRRAAIAFDDGTRAYKQREFDQAASHFEAADEAVPSAQALRLAIRSRAKAGQRARAATLAGQALLRYPEDDKLAAVANATIAASQDELHRVEVSCSPACILALDTRAVPGKARGRWLLFLPPGQTTISASFGQGRADQQMLVARAGGSNALKFQSATPSVPGPVASPSATGASPSAASPSVGEQPAEDAVESQSGDDTPSWIQSPWVFVGALTATAAVGGVTIWSGVDTVNNPGEDVVRERCVGLGTGCSEYQDGLARQTRTNILIGASAGSAVLTAVIGLLVTDWGGDGEVPASAQAAVAPWVRREGAGLALGGRF